MQMKLDNYIEDINLLAKRLFEEKGVMPETFFNSSLSDIIEVQNAKEKDQRWVDPLELVGYGKG